MTPKPGDELAPRRPRVQLRWAFSVKAQTVLSAVIVLGVALSLASFLLVVELSHAQVGGIDQSLRLELASVSTIARNGTLPQPLQIASQETSFIQVVDAHGRVIASSAGLVGESRISAVNPGNATVFFTRDQLPIGSGERFRVSAETISTPAGKMTVYVGESLVVVDRSIHDVVLALLLASPILLVIVGLMVWWLVRRALMPVEAIRSEVEVISGSELGRRVAEPVVHDEIGRLATTMNHMLERLEKASSRQKSFVADASHELRSPLAAAQTELEVSLTHVESTDWPESARAALGELERVRRIVDDLSLLAKYDEDEMPAAALPVDLEEIVMGQCSRLRKMFPIAVDTAQVSGARVSGDEEQLGRAVWNLLDNAQRHARQRVSVSLTSLDGHAVLRVADDGPGVKLEDRNRIFERFVRSDSVRSRVDGGSGLGLAIVTAIVAAHHGSIEVEDVNPGAEFIVRLPLSA